MEKESGGFDLAFLMKIANSPAGQQLLSLVAQHRDEQFDEAMHRAEAGDYTQAQKKLQEMLSSTEAQDLMKKIRGEQ